MENFNGNLNGIYVWFSAICLFIVDETFKDDHQYKKKNISNLDIFPLISEWYCADSDSEINLSMWCQTHYDVTDKRQKHQFWRSQQTL